MINKKGSVELSAEWMVAYILGLALFILGLILLGKIVMFAMNR